MGFNSEVLVLEKILQSRTGDVCDFLVVEQNKDLTHKSQQKISVPIFCNYGKVNS